MSSISRHHAVWVTCLLMLCGNAKICHSAKPSAPLRYRLSKKQVVAYRVEVTAEVGDNIETMAGVISYTLTDSNNERLQITSRGGLKKTQKAAKPAAANRRFGRRPGRPPVGRGRFGGPRGRFGGPRGPRGPFGGTQFRGLTNSSNEIYLSPRGMVLRMTGTSQLPYLLGNLSLLPVEPLPDAAEETWFIRSDVAITKSNERSTSRPIFRRSPFQRTAPEERTSGSETKSYKVESDNDKLVIITKTYELRSPTAIETSYQIQGSGKWTFNRELGVSEKLDLKQTLSVRVKNVTIAIPMTIKYSRLSEAELKKHQEKVKAGQAKRQALFKALREKRAKQAAAPLTKEDKKTILSGLKSTQLGPLIRSLHRLLRKSPKTPDQEIAKAVEALFKHKNRAIQNTAKSVAKKWPVTDRSK